MSIQLGSAYGKVALDVAGLLSGVAKGKAGLTSLAATGVQVGAAMKNVGNMMTLGLTLPIVAMGAASIKAASDFEETKNKAIVVFGEMSDSVVSNANKSATALGISKTQYLDYASSIGAALKAGGMSVKESTELSEQAVKHFADLASFHNSQVQDVALAWQSAIRGQYEPIQRFFPFITDSYLKTYGVANGLVDSNTSKLTANQRAIILNAIALDERLNPALNDFAETSGGLANQTRILKAQWQDALVTLGQNLLPIALKVVSALNSMLEKFNQLTPVQQKMILGFLGLVALAGPLISFLGTVVTIISSIAGLIGTLSTMGISLAGIGAIITGTVIPAIIAVGSALLPVLIVIGALILVIGLLYLAWKTNFLGIRDIMNTSVKFWTALLRAFFAFLRGDTKAATEYAKEAFTIFGDHINKVFLKLFGIKDAWGKFLEFMRNALGRLVSYITNVFTKTNWSQLGRYITLGIANGLLGGIPALVLAAAKAGEAALAAIKKKLDIKSPSGAFEKLGMYSAQGYQIGLAKSMKPDDIARTMARPVNQMSSSQQQHVTVQLSSGLTIQQAREMIAANNEQMMNTIIGALGGG
ncbi:MAG: hypothetical protein EHM40_11565 [Chloroflexi bacterium]|nr:MAG: hypothetical protein EHM40_11565 [Chloroflexota bacterium]